MEAEKKRDTRFYLKELMGEECQCGKPKKSKFSFCYGCYKKLPGHMQKDLYNVIGCGYEEAYEAAVKHLSE